MKRLFSSGKHHYRPIASIFLIMVVMASLMAGMVGCGGGGPIKVYSWLGLDSIRDDLSADYILMNDLNATTLGYYLLAGATANGGNGWDPIGSVDDPFTGTFDGQGYEIGDFAIDRPARDCVGLFSVVGEEGVVENLGVANATVTGNQNVGGLIGLNDYGAHVSHCYFTGSVIGNAYVGGLVGNNYGDVNDSYSGSSVHGSLDVGGLVGLNNHFVSNSYSIGNVVGSDAVGGLVGDNHGNMNNSYSTGNVTGSLNVGGLVGWDDHGSVLNSHYDYSEVLINGENIITIGALYDEDFEEWLANDKFLDVNDRLSQEGDYYVVNNVNDFKRLLAFGQDDSLRFSLKNDLDLATDPNFYIPYLAGEFDGNGHKISNLSFNGDSISQVGLFGHLFGNLASVNDVHAENVSVAACKYIGGLVGINNEGTVSNCHSTGSVTGLETVGGLVGYNYVDPVSNCSFVGDVVGSEKVGGLVGVNDEGPMSNCVFVGDVTGGDSYIGGLVGDNDEGDISHSYSTGSVTGSNSYVGGLVGFNSGSVSDSCSTANVTGSEMVGGLVGTNGGAVGNSYSAGSVSSGDSYYVGGLTGNNYGGTVSNSFWDTETSGQSTSHGGTGKTTVEMKDIATFSGATWDIVAVGGTGERNTDYIWNIVDDVTYPFLSWQPV